MNLLSDARLNLIRSWRPCSKKETNTEVKTHQQENLSHSALVKKYKLKPLRVNLTRLSQHVLDALHMQDVISGDAKKRSQSQICIIKEEICDEEISETISLRDVKSEKMKNYDTYDDQREISDTDLIGMREVRTALLCCLKSWCRKNLQEKQVASGTTQNKRNIDGGISYCDVTNIHTNNVKLNKLNKYKTSEVSAESIHNPYRDQHKNRQKDANNIQRNKDRNRFHLVPLSKRVPQRYAVPQTVKCACYPCSFCTKDYQVLAALNYHIAQKHRYSSLNNAGFVCTLCETQLSTKSALSEHEYQHETWLQCSQCDAKFTSQSSLIRHHEHFHVQELRCPHCSASFESNLELRGHLKSEHAETLHKTTWFIAVPK